MDPGATRRRPLFVAPSEPGQVRATAEDTGGRLGLVETAIPPGHSTPMHVHEHEDEAFYVLEGWVDFVCGGERFRGEPGAFVYLPRGIPHSFLGVGRKPARVLVLLLPGGLEEAFADPSRFAELLVEHGVEVVGPPLT